MRFTNLTLALGLALALVTSAPALAQTSKEAKGVIEKLDVAAMRMVVKETHGRKHRIPLAIEKDALVVMPTGPASLADLHAGDEAIVKYGASSGGEMAHEIQVTKSATSGRQ